MTKKAVLNEYSPEPIYANPIEGKRTNPTKS